MRRDNFAVNRDTKISAVLARAGVSERPPVGLGRTSWLDVQTVGQLSAALRSQAAAQDNASASVDWGSPPFLRRILSQFDASVALQGNHRQQMLTPNYVPAPNGQVSHTSLDATLRVLLQDEADEWRALKAQRAWELRLKGWKSAKLAALAAAIAAIDAAIGRALSSGDVLTYLALLMILVRLRYEYVREAAQ